MPQLSHPDRPYWWQWATILSLDAPLVAVLWQNLFARVAGLRLDWHDPVLLGLAVWIVYAADRWVEGWRLSPDEVKTQRHRFYILHRWPVFFIGLVAIVTTTVIAITRLEEREFKTGFILLVPTMVYLFSHQLVHRNHPLRLPKEVCIAAIFSLGCALAPAVLAPAAIPTLILPAVLFGLLCLANCALIADWETDVDRSHGQTSLALQLKRFRGLISALPWVLAMAGLASIPLTSAHTGLCVAVSGALLGLLDLAQPSIGRELARALVDFTLMTPAAVLLLP